MPEPDAVPRALSRLGDFGWIEEVEGGRQGTSSGLDACTAIETSTNTLNGLLSASVSRGDLASLLPMMSGLSLEE